jgi:hypothetical protein
MGRGLVRFERDGREWFVEWSTVVDAPITYGLTEAELRDYIREEYGRQGSADLDERIVRCRGTGTSFRGETGPTVILGNRAGHNEALLSEDEIVEWYCVRREEPPEGIGREHEE